MTEIQRDMQAAVKAAAKAGDVKALRRIATALIERADDDAIWRAGVDLDEDAARR